MNIIYGDRKAILILAFILFFIGSFILFFSYKKNDISFNNLIVITTLYSASLILYIWSKRVKIIIYDDYFFYLNFFKSKKLYFSKIIEISIHKGYEDAYSPINSTNIHFNDGFKIKINNYIFDSNEFIKLINKKINYKMK